MELIVCVGERRRDDLVSVGSASVSCFLDEAGLEVGGAAGRAAQQQVLLVDQAVQQVLLPVVVVDLEEGHDGDAEPGEPRGPQSELQQGTRVSGCQGFGAWPGSRPYLCYGELVVKGAVVQAELQVRVLQVLAAEKEPNVPSSHCSVDAFVRDPYRVALTCWASSLPR